MTPIAIPDRATPPTQTAAGKRANETQQIEFRETFQRMDRKRAKGAIKFMENGEAVGYGESEGAWVSGLPEEHRLSDAK